MKSHRFIFTGRISSSHFCVVLLKLPKMSGFNVGGFFRDGTTRGYYSLIVEWGYSIVSVGFLVIFSL